jgi:hypothetical protein
MRVCVDAGRVVGMSDLNYPMPNSPRIPIETLEKAAVGERELRTKAKTAVDAFFSTSGTASSLLAAMNELKTALGKVPA